MLAKELADSSQSGPKECNPLKKPKETQCRANKYGVADKYGEEAFGGEVFCNSKTGNWEGPKPCTGCWKTFGAKSYWYVWWYNGTCTTHRECQSLTNSSQAWCDLPPQCTHKKEHFFFGGRCCRRNQCAYGVDPRPLL
eukprot:gnl/MRDRNA2_/MRDRNA2_211756_c0_seq1.p1 gnl/MRDRNA2_/MRDRNA2_211756_c0~~gnl/MRDRNA2_/MRDRNA2_211756_c0_seq1.p1  ORF type:complete len:150 (-),score=20.62 gnl/MRDRNA2_/MRDRNA2_211756_c0_seq1:52-465(-)